MFHRFLLVESHKMVLNSTNFLDFKIVTFWGQNVLIPLFLILPPFYHLLPLTTSYQLLYYFYQYLPPSTSFYYLLPIFTNFFIFYFYQVLLPSTNLWQILSLFTNFYHLLSFFRTLHQVLLPFANFYELLYYFY